MSRGKHGPIVSSCRHRANVTPLEKGNVKLPMNCQTGSADRGHGKETILLRMGPPITAAIVVAGGLMGHAKMNGIQQGLLRVGEVLLGCFVGLAGTWPRSKLWPLPVMK
jgi:hypothetical protein